MTSPDRIAKGLYWDRAWSLVSGCSYVSEGCRNCWSAAETHMRAAQKSEKIQARYAGLTTPEGRWNGKIRLLEDNLWMPARVKKPTTWAVWNDLFHDDVPDEFIDHAFAIMALSHWHTFLILTKRPERMRDYVLDKGTPARIARTLEEISEKDVGYDQFAEDIASGLCEWPFSGVWFGVTAENQEQFDLRWPYLRDTPAEIIYISYEPALGPLVLPSDFLERGKRAWLIAGVESGPNRRTAKIEWIRDLRDQCVAAGVDFFLKQMEVNGKLVKMPELDGRIWYEMPGVTL